MSDAIPDELPLHDRLALSYAPASSRERILTLMLLDVRLASLVRARSDTLIAQLKLAWWRDRFRADRADWPVGEPLLERLRHWPGDAARLGEMVDAWEVILGEAMTESDLRGYAAGRAAGWLSLAEHYGADRNAARHAAETWALVDLSLNASDEGEAEEVRAIARERMAQISGLNRALRPLAVLAGLARRNLAIGADKWLDGPGALALALRIGLTGR